MKTRWLILLAFSCAAVAQSGESVYRQHCAMCHESPQGRTPSVDSLRAMSNAAILRALETGVMREQAKALTAEDRAAVAEYLHGASDKTANAVPSSAYCNTAASAASSAGSNRNGFGGNLANTRFQSKDDAGLGASDVPKLRLRWAFSLGDVTMARGQPVVVGGRLYAGAVSGKLYSLDAKTGCLYWQFDAVAAIRSGVMVGAAGQSGEPAVFFGDAKANAYGVDAATGKLLWKTHVDDHPGALITAAPTLSDGVLYFGVSSFEEFAGAQPSYECCTFRGSVVALEAATGKIIWKTYTVAQPPSPTTKTASGVQRHGPSGVAVWATPTIDLKRNAIYVSTGDNYSDPTTDTSDAIMALDRATGKILWSRQMTANDAYTVDCESPVKTNCPASKGPDFDFGQPPILVSLSNGKRALVIGQKSGVAYAIDPDQQGKVLWQTRIGKGGSLGGSEWGSAADENRMFVALSDIAFKLIKDPANPSTPKIALDPEKGGGLFALDLRTGGKIWSAPAVSCGTREKCSPAQSAAVSAIPGAVFSGSSDGHFRAYSTSTGEILWDYDTARDYDAVNGKAHGGAIDGGGPAIAGGMVYLYSGYNQWGGVPGNALLAFSVDGK
ncbi:MAG TPA: PQQ-binding-like beta-propeller repeat protein [Candidatus Sulfotelmatobacter sp.]|nr:PQQ-binding-like beta-propeller repeat protein [Candidatus Sulfotelmatobacter sp.]